MHVNSIVGSWYKVHVNSIVGSWYKECELDSGELV